MIAAAGPKHAAMQGASVAPSSLAHHGRHRLSPKPVAALHLRRLPCQKHDQSLPGSSGRYGGMIWRIAEPRSREAPAGSSDSVSLSMEPS